MKFFRVTNSSHNCTVRDAPTALGPGFVAAAWVAALVQVGVLSCVNRLRKKRIAFGPLCNQKRKMWETDMVWRYLHVLHQCKATLCSCIFIFWIDPKNERCCP